MASFTERMRLRAKACRESANFAPEKTFAEDLKKFIPHPQQSAMSSSFDRSNNFKNCNAPLPEQPSAPDISNMYSSSRAKLSAALNSKNVKEHSPLKELTVSNKTSPGFNAFPTVKPVTVSPPKPGNLYPCLRGMEVVTDSEEQSSNNSSVGDEPDDKENMNESVDSDSSEGSVENFHIVNMDASFSGPDNRLKRRSDSSSSSNERNSILSEMDSFLQSAFNSDTSFGPSPAKSICNDSLETSVSTSFTYQEGSPVKTVFVEEKAPILTHSVSFYRKQQDRTLTPSNKEKQERKDTNTRAPVIIREEKPVENFKSSASSKIEKLQTIAKAQENIISQAAGALSVCFSNPEFTNSTQRVEAERLLLVASHKKKAILSEIEKLKKSPNQLLKPTLDNSTLTISNICLPIKSDMVLRATKANTSHYLVGLVKSNEQVFGTALVLAAKENLVQNSRKIVYVKFPNSITLPEVTPDFKVTIEIYDLVIPVNPVNGKSSAVKKEVCKLWITPKKPKQNLKLRKAVSRSTLKSSNFKIIGCGVFTLNDVHSSKINLTKMSVPSLLEGTICFRSDCDVTASLEHRGFLTMFDDISGLGAWHRRWCLLSGNQLLFWKYPEDENSKETIGSIDLSSCVSTEISAVSRDICARLNTFSMECARPAKASDMNSQILTRKGSQTIVRYLLSADTRESRNEWCDNLNKVLSIIRQWKK